MKVQLQHSALRSALQLPALLVVLLFAFPLARDASAGELIFKTWAAQRPNSIVVISGVIDGVTPLFGPKMIAGVTWVDNAGVVQAEHLQVLCKINSGYSRQCGELADRQYHHRIEEIYIGAPDGLVLQPDSGNKRHKNLINSDMSAVPPGVKRVIYANVYALGSKRQAIALVFDENISDSDLRWILLEEAVYRVYGWRDE